MADKAFNSEKIRAFIQEQGATVCVPDKSNSVVKHDFDAELYKQRNIVERFSNAISPHFHSFRQVGYLLLEFHFSCCFYSFSLIYQHTLSEPEKILELRKLLRGSSLSVIPKISYNAAYRAQISKNVAVDAYVLYAWQCLCERLAEKVPIDSTLDKSLLREKLSEIKSLMFVEPNAMQEQLTKIFAECGIVFCIVKHFRGAPVQGFIKHTERGQLILCMTIRQARADIFWFTLFHEIAHVLNGDADERFVDFSSIKTEIEARADEFAREFLLDKNAYKNFFNTDDFSESAVKKFSESQNVLPCIVTGRLQSDGIIGWDCLSSTLLYYRWLET